MNKQPNGDVRLQWVELKYWPKMFFLNVFTRGFSEEVGKKIT